MSLVDFPVKWGVDQDGIASPSIGNIVIDAAGEAFACSFPVPKTGTITNVLFRCTAVTSFQDMTISLETPGTDGLPSGTNYGGSTPGTWTGGAANTSPEVALGTGASATAGDLVYLRGEWAGSAGNLILAFLNGGSAQARRFPKVLPDTGSGFSLTTPSTPMLCLKYDDGSYVVPLGCAPPMALTSITIDSGTSPQEVGFWLTPQAAVTLEGCGIRTRTFGTTQNSTLSLYSTPSGTPASQRSFVSNHNQQSTSGNNAIFYLPPYGLTAATDYVLAFLQSSTDDFTLYYAEVDNVNHWGGWAGGTHLVYAARNSGGGAFTKTSTRKLIGCIYLSQIHDGSGGGGAGPLIGGRLVG